MLLSSTSNCDKSRYNPDIGSYYCDISLYCRNITTDWLPLIVNNNDINKFINININYDDSMCGVVRMSYYHTNPNLLMDMCGDLFIHCWYDAVYDSKSQSIKSEYFDLLKYDRSLIINPDNFIIDAIVNLMQVCINISILILTLIMNIQMNTKCSNNIYIII